MMEEQVGASVDTRSAYQSELSSHLDRGAGHPEEGGAKQVSAYCKELLMRGGIEFSFEELRAERFKQRKLQQLEEKLKHQSEVKQQLSQELESKKKLLLLRTSQVLQDASQISRSAPPAASFHIYDESQSAAARPAGNSEKSPNELQDDVFLRPDERGLCLQVQYPRPGAVGVSQVCRPQTEVLSSAAADADPHLQTLAGPQKPASKTRKDLSPIQETSVEANSLSAGNCSPLQEDQDQDQEHMDLDQEDQDQDQAPPPVGGAVDPCDPDVRRRLLLALRDVTSSPDFHSESRPLPAVEQHGCLQLGDATYLVRSTVLDAGSFSVYEGVTDDSGVVLKVDRCCVPWDFHQSLRLKDSSTADSLPRISCFLFLDGCITVFTTPPDHKFTELTECVLSEVSVCFKAVALLQLVSQLHSCRLLHAALQPPVLTCSSRGSLIPDWVFPVDWSSSLDLDLQRDVTSVQQVPSAQRYISLGLLEPTAPPQLVDLVGLAETVHVLLTNNRMVPVKDESGWTAEQFSGDEPCDTFSTMWRRFFRSLLNADGRSPSSVLSELKEQLSALCH